MLSPYNPTYEVVDLKTMQLSSWPSAPVAFGSSPACSVSWRDSLIAFGTDGGSDVQLYNITTKVKTQTNCNYLDVLHTS